MLKLNDKSTPTQRRLRPKRIRLALVADVSLCCSSLDLCRDHAVRLTVCHHHKAPLAPQRPNINHRNTGCSVARNTKRNGTPHTEPRIAPISTYLSVLARTY